MSPRPVVPKAAPTAAAGEGTPIGTEEISQAARDAVIHTLPLFEMARMRAATSPRKHPVHGFAASEPTSTLRWVNLFTHTRRLLTPNDREVVTPNNDTLYTNAWLDLSDGPLVIEVPDMGERYWTLGFLDMWTNPFAYAGRRTTGNRAQRLFVHGPRWRGEVPAGLVGIAAPGADLWIIGRILVDPDEADIASVGALQQQFAILRASDLEPAARIVDTVMNGRKTDTPDADEYAAIVDAAWARNPAAEDDTAARADWHRTKAEGVAALQAALVQVCSSLRHEAQASQVGGGWSIPVTVRNGYGTQTLLRARVARNLIGALGIEEAMYPVAEVDAEGLPLDGRHAYELYFPPGAAPQVDAFWSLTMYRKSTCLLVDNPIDRYSIGDRTPGLRYEADGGLRIAIQVDAPSDPGANWLPAPREPFYLTLRLYQPRRAHLEFSFTYPPLRRLD
ncbi:MULTISPECIES: DUF1254 domain-containing protein [unclassified Variovorax]|uniref:DUF1254 domain-containing protein n=1 Tax=unclassified Variovorax TaxID=663243 RepID=UPI00076DC1EF|nr:MULTISPECIES: DUF1254 domain-containing protein [unclassified Variovorax]KWT94183.1 putative exported protein [Variovorax sp. WDL1]PNG59860.1 hypothetical protein CHC07_01589 [Variovorax sp. B4]PNG60349.1 hypothetical protein CHC06_00246 [Variovorax sp. B2]VTV13794.1 hypothetical protein WDL1CHR_04425 [Variovorax sp. WDL1]